MHRASLPLLAALALVAACAGDDAGDTDPSGTSTGGDNLCQTLACGLVHAYTFDEADALPDAIGEADALLINVADRAVSGQAGGAWRFNTAAGESVELPAGMLDGLAGLTICAWYDLDGGSADEILFSWENSVDGGQLGPAWWSVGNSISGDGKSTGWHLTCGVADKGRGLELYVDGVLQGDDPFKPIENDGASARVAIGLDLSTLAPMPTYGYFDGIIDEIYIWDRGLGADEIEALHGMQGASFW